MRSILLFAAIGVPLAIPAPPRAPAAPCLDAVIGLPSRSECTVRYGASFDSVQNALRPMLRSAGSTTLRGELVIVADDTVRLRFDSVERAAAAPGLMLSAVDVFRRATSISEAAAVIRRWRARLDSASLIGNTAKCIRHFDIKDRAFPHVAVVEYESSMAVAGVTSRLSSRHARTLLGTTEHSLAMALSLAPAGDSGKATAAMLMGCEATSFDSAQLAAVRLTPAEVQSRWFVLALNTNERVRRCIAQREASRVWQECGDTLAHRVPARVLRATARGR